MNRILKISAIVAATAAFALPAFAASTAATAPAPMAAGKPMAKPMMVADTATVMTGTAKSALRIAELAKLIGHWSSAEITGLDHAKSVTVFDKSVYSTADQAKLDSALKADKARLGKFQAAVASNASLKAWLTKNKIGANNVVAISDQKGHFGIYLG